MYNNSPLKEFYPENVKIDFKCTNLLWKATPLLPILDGQQIKDYFSIPDLEIKKWFNSLGLTVRDMSFTVWNDEIHTSTQYWCHIYI